MSKIFRPRRGKASTWASKNPVLAAGELVIEIPDAGLGKGLVKMKMGDGTTAYNSLPYAVMDAVDPSDSAITFTASSNTENSDLLGEIVSGNALKLIVGATKKMLTNLDSSVTELNNNFSEFRPIRSVRACCSN